MERQTQKAGVGATWVSILWIGIHSHLDYPRFWRQSILLTVLTIITVLIPLLALQTGRLAIDVFLALHWC